MKNPPLFLVIDDVKRLADLLARGLRHDFPGSITLTASSLEEAVSIIQKEDIDAVVTDWVLDPQNKKINALPVIKAAHKKDPTCVSIIFTGDPTAFNRYKHAYDEGAYDVILKVQVGVQLAREISVKLAKALERRELLRKAGTYARHFDHKLQEWLGPLLIDRSLERRWLTIMFVDVHGFSAITDEIGAHHGAITEFLSEYYTLIVECAHNHDGVVDKFMGDGAMILFGAKHRSQEVDPEPSINAVNAALQMQSRSRDLLKRFGEKIREMETSEQPELALGFGINRAEVYVGIISTPNRDQYTAIGQGVNLAAWIESVAGTQRSGETGAYGSILVTGSVQRQIVKQFRLNSEPPLAHLRGFGKGLPVWSVKSRK